MVVRYDVMVTGQKVGSGVLCHEPLDPVNQQLAPGDDKTRLV
jgi:hypothetical protein